ncbi:hypothetical protein pgond44_08971 [Psychroflexus gondwanensis ACAM 44]|jgi:hypothetical protein|uniref:Co-chaperone DjlA N-terminal domain-containing protein n=1 Tax=Psychroflexus gondwanensis ACAM 44 TaxID=1189619 RepID=N1WNW4_9FLAO|nr:hypothetical protein [Psychroflexus gondwanensis]EMY80685.1 hypothetical protein pgond44_08971 [Psychroflexus gondwanensis ACAM 44]
MKHKAKNWTKTELQVYILLMCANADKEQTKEELNMISSKVDKETFDKMAMIFKADSEEKRLIKISKNIQQQSYSVMELGAFRKEIHEVFLSDNKFTMMEQRLDWTLDNILY